MEFYPTAESDPLPPKVRFNSQRDGILHDRHFSFVGESNGFNSQRDGILQYTEIPRLCKQTVSIPNGMEFYFLLLCVTRALHWFQFPTGWNSTGLRQTPFICLPSFNSQRDGILRYYVCFSAIGHSEFQFPTGWNSTIRNLEIL